MMRIAMWSGPRSISTALMRSFENRPDTTVSDEPFYAHYLHSTGEDHPFREETILQGEISWDTVAQKITGDIPDKKHVWYQKHMAQHNLPGKDLTWIWKMCNILLIRDPMKVISSYSKKHRIGNIFHLGYSQQTDLFNMLKNGSDDEPIIVDAQDVLKDPQMILQELCKRITIPFYKEMITWPAGRRESDGIWGKHWYSSVEKSTGFNPVSKDNAILPEKFKGIYAECMEHYQQLYQHRMRLI